MAYCERIRALLTAKTHISKTGTRVKVLPTELLALNLRPDGRKGKNEPVHIKLLRREAREEPEVHQMYK